MCINLMLIAQIVFLLKCGHKHAQTHTQAHHKVAYATVGNKQNAASVHRDFHRPIIFTTRRYAKRGICRHRVSVCLCVCLSVPPNHPNFCIFGRLSYLRSE